MPKIATPLTDRAVKALKTKGMHAVGGCAGLYLAISEGHGRSWVLRIKVGDQRRDFGLGSVTDVSLAEARARGQELRSRLLAGQPVETVRAITFAEVAERFIVEREGGWKNPVHRHQWRQTMRDHILPIIGARSVASISASDVAAVLTPLWQAKPETARRVRQRIEAVLDAAKVWEFRTGENPARLRGNLDLVLSKQKTKQEHHPAMPWRDVPVFWHELAAKDGVAAQALAFAILTAARTGEVIGARWSEIDEAERLWRVPAERMKAGRDHTVPLSDAALAVIAAMRPLSGTAGDGPIFPGAKGAALSNMALAAVLKRMGRDNVTVHGFRSSFADWASENGVAAEVREACLAHTMKDRVAAAYTRTDFLETRRGVLARWAALVLGA